MRSLKDTAFLARRKIGLAWLDRQGRRALAVRGHAGLFDRRPAEAKPPVWSDLWFLYRKVRERKPKVVLEFGSGCSTIVYAQALADNAEEGAPGRIWSLDADPHWGQVTIDSMPEHLAPYCDIQITPAIACDFAGVPVWRYRDVPEVTPDLVYLDGPALTKDRRAAVDVLDIEDRFPRGFRLIVDGRAKNCELLERHFKRRYRRERHPILKNTVYDLVDE
ncbi:MAG: hypothetical protein RIM84_17980 [Alphaproteobacteria bacterium]